MFGVKPDIKDMTGKYTEYEHSTLTSDGTLIPKEDICIRDKCIIESSNKYSEYIVDMRYLADYLRYLEKRIDCLESILQDDGK